MRSALRTPDAIVFCVNLSQGSVRPKSQFDKTIEVDCEVDLAGIAVNLRGDILQRHAALLWTTTHRAEQIPLEIEQTHSSGMQTNFEDDATRLVPFIRQLVGTDTCNQQIVSILNEIE